MERVPYNHPDTLWSLTVGAHRKQSALIDAHIERIVYAMERMNIPLHYELWQNILLDGEFRLLSRAYIYKLIRLAAMQDKIVRIRPGVYMAHGAHQ